MTSEGNYLKVHQQGYAVFIVNIEPKGGKGHFEFQPRAGAREDVGNLQTIFGENLGFNWVNRKSYWHENLTVCHWDHRKRTGQNSPTNPAECCICCHIQSLDHSQSKAFVLAISSHGRELTETEIIFSDGQSIYLTEIFDALSDDNCPSLKGIPRIIVLQACRSQFEEKERVEKMQCWGVEIKVSTSQLPAAGAKGTNNSTDKPDDPPAPDSNYDYTFQQAALNKMPSDFLLVYPVVSGQLAQRNRNDGSWLFHGLKELLIKNYSEQKPVNFLHLLTQVSGLIARERETIVFKRKEGTREIEKDENGQPKIDADKSGVKNAVCCHHRLTKPLIFYPKINDKTELPDLPSFNFDEMKKKKKGK